MELPLTKLTSIAATLCLLAHGLAAHADVLGIPYSDRFPQASFPYAFQAETCSDDQLPGRFGQKSTIDFSTACQAHRQCWYTLGKTWSECNQEYLSRLHRDCSRELHRARLERAQLAPVDAEAMKLCLDLADLYAAKSQERAALKAFDKAQQQQYAYRRYVSAVIHQLYIARLKRPASESEMDLVWQRLNSGISLSVIGNGLGHSAARDEESSTSPLLDEY